MSKGESGSLQAPFNPNYAIEDRKRMRLSKATELPKESSQM